MIVQETNLIKVADIDHWGRHSSYPSSSRCRCMAEASFARARRKLSRQLQLGLADFDWEIEYCQATYRIGSRESFHGGYYRGCREAGQAARGIEPNPGRHTFQAVRNGLGQGRITSSQHSSWSWLLARTAEIRDQDLLGRLENEIGSGPSSVLRTRPPSTRRYALLLRMLDLWQLTYAAEPSNMLDVPSITFLSNYLQDYPGTVLVVSHDRSFLNEVATDIVHQHSERLDYYRGANFGMLRCLWFMRFSGSHMQMHSTPPKRSDGKRPKESMIIKWPSGPISKVWGIAVFDGRPWLTC